MTTTPVFLLYGNPLDLRSQYPGFEKILKTKTECLAADAARDEQRALESRRCFWRGVKLLMSENEGYDKLIFLKNVFLGGKLSLVNVPATSLSLRSVWLEPLISGMARSPTSRTSKFACRILHMLWEGLMDLQGHVVGDEHPSICCENQSRKGVDTCVPFRKKNMIFTVKKKILKYHTVSMSG